MAEEKKDWQIIENKQQNNKKAKQNKKTKAFPVSTVTYSGKKNILQSVCSGWSGPETSARRQQAEEIKTRMSFVLQNVLALLRQRVLEMEVIVDRGQTMTFLSCVCRLLKSLPVSLRAAEGALSDGTIKGHLRVWVKLLFPLHLFQSFWPGRRCRFSRRGL